MPTRPSPAALIGVCLAVPAAIAHAQGSSSDCSTRQHYDQFPPGWTCHSWNFTVERDWYNVVVDGADIVETITRTPWEIVDAYFCGYTACDEIVRPDPIEVMEQTRIEICVHAGLTYTTEASAALKVRLIAELGVQAQAEWNLEINGCYEKTRRRTYTIARMQCFPSMWREAFTKRKLNGYVEEAKERATWEVRYGPGCTGDWQTTVTYCGYREVSGYADDKSGLHVQQPPVFRPDEEIPPNDPYGGVRLHRCCQDPEPPAPPCCGCWVNP